ncbi:MAG: hypothetical protein ACE5HS_03765 [bacterium]
MLTKSKNNHHQRFVMYISDRLRFRIESWIKGNGMTLTDFGRAALIAHLNNKKREAVRAQLAETCRIFDGNRQ